MKEAHALVIGASSEIGSAIAVELASLGMSMSLWGRDRERLRRAAALCRQTGRHCSVDMVDVADCAAVGHAIQAVADRGPLTVAVYAAGMFDWAPAQTADPATWQRVIDVNLTAAATVTSHVLPMLIAAAPSSLVYVGSGAAHRAFANNAAYVASKHGLAGLAEAVFLDVRDLDVKVSLISPGMVAAGASLNTPAGKDRPHELLAPADVAEAVRFVVTFPVRGCPTQIRLHPQRTPN
ncbi:SDR family NAD(P)-dependent oxidoreductase [Actinoplanes sp. Pm04-4]|uniref:SDR family NAD(P)-dependent oxidoreductase n=1 Tax=Paractinoplanes pyxinae TaxID=2997416 RepID=A0ABT4BCB4_9ACTN|nr:SDR family NAD(P)-dependent oxidoreductase [Actinoplanes pyxinae]MCY1144157.1 SDR family NAD(P)-dependent oxidoreductase [Actinoplanes pyxinae]